VSSRLLGSGTIGAVLDASNWAASRPELGLAALTPRLFSFWSFANVRVASSGQDQDRTVGKEGDRGGEGRRRQPYCFHPSFSGGGCLTSASIGGLRMLPRPILLLWQSLWQSLWPATTVIDGCGRGEGVPS